MKVNDVVSVHTDDGIRSAIVIATGNKFVSLVWVDDSGVRIHKILHNQLRAKLMEYSLVKAKKAFRRMGRTFGITKSARHALRA